MESKVLQEYDDAKDNKRVSVAGINIVFYKAGAYILNMGAVNFFEYLIINLMLIIHVDRRQRAALIENPTLTFF